MTKQLSMIVAAAFAAVSKSAFTASQAVAQDKMEKKGEKMEKKGEKMEKKGDKK